MRQLKVDGIAGATADPVCKDAMLKNDSSQTPCGWLEWLSAVVDTSRSFSGPHAILPCGGG